jgi:hypothetical protein
MKWRGGVPMCWRAAYRFATKQPFSAAWLFAPS